MAWAWVWACQSTTSYAFYILHCQYPSDQTRSETSLPRTRLRLSSDKWALRFLELRPNQVASLFPFLSESFLTCRLNSAIFVRRTPVPPCSHVGFSASGVHWGEFILTDVKQSTCGASITLPCRKSVLISIFVGFLFLAWVCVRCMLFLGWFTNHG